VAQTLVFAAPRLISALMSVPPRRKLTETLLSADPSNVVAFKNMFRPNLLTLSILAAAAVYAVAADQPPAPQDSKNAVPSPGKEPAKKPADDDRTGGKTAGATGGVVVFIDPATGQIRQPDASEIGGLIPSTGSVAPKAPEPALIQGPGGAVGARLGEDSLTYMVVTTAPDGQLAMDCVTGDKAAAARVTAPTVTSPAPKAKETSAGPARAQNTHDVTHDVKLPR
jgi:hypothetical protein